MSITFRVVGLLAVAAFSDRLTTDRPTEVIAISRLLEVCARRTKRTKKRREATKSAELNYLRHSGE